MRALLGRLIAALALGLAPTGASAAWHEARSKHFVIYSDDDPQRLHDFAVRLEKFDKAVRLVRGMADPPLTDSRRLTVYVLRNEDAVQQLIRLSGALGLYEGRAAGSFAFVPRKAGDGGKFDLDSEAVFFHEYAHHLQLQQSTMALPAWFVEGFAEFFATAEFQKDGSVLIGSVPAYRGWGLQNVAAGLSLEQILGSTYKSLDGAKLERLYAQGWLLTHYLTFEPSRKGQLERYLAGIQKGLSATEAARAAFGELSTLNRELERYKKVRLTAVEVAAKALTISPIALRALTPGEGAIMKVHIRSTRGVDERTAAAVAREARKIAQKYPDDAFVQMALAEAELDVENLAAADRAADRALALRPDFVRALIFKGRAQLALAKQNPSAADWSAVRRWFLRANKLDTENAEALMLFYATYVAAKQQPTKNSVDGLIYAAALAPQDEGLRLAAFRELVSDNRLSEAREVFAPLAFRPHASDKWRQLTDKVLAAMDSGDRSAVLAVLDAEKKGKDGKEEDD